uniref:Histone deacetylase domain-containing protein n=2 Tax=Parascaris univalens TaxID=6257 RepID=A0A915B8X0_PARUN
MIVKPNRWYAILMSPTYDIFERCEPFSRFHFDIQRSSHRPSNCAISVTAITSLLAVIDLIFVIHLNLSYFIQLTTICTQLCLIHAIRSRNATWMIPFLMLTTIKLSSIAFSLFVSLKPFYAKTMFNMEITHLIHGPIWLLAEKLRNYYGSQLPNSIFATLFLAAASMNFIFLSIIGRYFCELRKPISDFSTDLFEENFDDDIVMHYCYNGGSALGAIEECERCKENGRDMACL